MDKKHLINAIEQNAFDARLTIAELCKKAEINPTSWSRIKRTGNIGVKTLRAMEDVLKEAMAERGAE